MTKATYHSSLWLCSPKKRAELALQCSFPVFVIYTDGSYKEYIDTGTAASLIYKKGEKQIYKQTHSIHKNTSVDRMELTATIDAFNALKEQSIIYLFTDSRYVESSANRFLSLWMRNNWKRVSKRTQKIKTQVRTQVQNIDLWKKFISSSNKHIVIIKWVKGHSTDKRNIAVDKLAKQYTI